MDRTNHSGIRRADSFEDRIKDGYYEYPKHRWYEDKQGFLDDIAYLKEEFHQDLIVEYKTSDIREEQFMFDIVLEQGRSYSQAKNLYNALANLMHKEASHGKD